jgi:hypothetical protein
MARTPVHVTCSSCGAAVKVPGRLLGKPCRCPRCDHVFVPPQPGFKPKLRNLRTSRGPLVLTAGICGLAFGVASLPLTIVGCCCSFTGGLAAAGIALAFSALAGIMGLVELTQVSRGTREDSQAARVGMILGWCGVAMGFVGAAFALLWEFVIAAGS